MARCPLSEQHRRPTLKCPASTSSALSRALGGLRGKRVIVLGVSYRPDVKETAFSAAFPVVAALRKEGAHTLVHDPLFSDQELKDCRLRAGNVGGPHACRRRDRSGVSRPVPGH